MARALYRLGQFCARRSLVMIGVWGVILVLVVLSVRTFGGETNNDLSLPGTGSQDVKDLLEERFPPQQNGVSPLVFDVQHGKLTDSTYKQPLTESIKAIRKAPHVYSITNPVSSSGQTAGLLADDKQTAFAPLLLDISSGDLDESEADEIFAAADPARRAGITVEAAGTLGSELSDEASESSEVVGIVAAMVILSLVLGSLVAMGLPIVSAVLGLVVGLSSVALLGHLLAIPTTGATLATMIGLGVGIDYALFLISRHQEQLRGGLEVNESIAKAVATSGSAIVFAGSTVVIALVALRVAQIPLVATLGLASAVAVITAVLAAITLLPALLGLLGRHIEKGALPAFLRGKPGSTGGMWARWSGWVSRHPVGVAVAALALLAPLIYPVQSLALGQEDIGAADPKTTERKAYDLIAAGFGVGYNGPLQVASELDPVAAPSAEFTNKYNKAESLKKDLEQKQKQLPKEQKELEQQSDQLKAEQASLEDQQASLERQADDLQAQQARLEAQGARLQESEVTLEEQQAELEAEGGQLQADERGLQRQQARLEREQARLEREEQQLERERTRLRREAQALAQEIRPLARQLARTLVRERVLERRIDRLDDRPRRQARLEQRLAQVREQEQQVRAELLPLGRQARELAREALQLAREAEQLQVEAQQLETEGAELRRQADELRTEGAALQRQADQLQAQAERLRARGARLQDRAATLESDGAELQARGAELQQEGDDLQRQANQLQREGDQLQQQGDELKAEQQQAKQEQKQAEKLQNELTKQLTAAGGDERGTDPRVVALQDALSGTDGVVALTPPQINKKGDVVILSAVPSTAPASDDTADLVETVRSDVIPPLEGQGGMTSYVGGYTASYVDLASLISARLVLVIGTVILLGFLLLMIAFRSLLIPLQAAITNLLSAAAAFGVLTATFQWGWGVSAVGLDASGSVPIASYVPLMMFACLFGLSMDYEVFLVSHVEHHHMQGEPPREAVASGLRTSARITTAAALIMASVFASFILNGDPTIKQFGVGLSVAVLLAGLLVVTLAPAVLMLFGAAAWWLPRWLDRLLPHISIEGEPTAPPALSGQPADGVPPTDEDGGFVLAREQPPS
ncbi:MAG: MMPL family transporter [Nocardioidaceae bacterium]